MPPISNDLCAENNIHYNEYIKDMNLAEKLIIQPGLGMSNEHLTVRCTAYVCFVFSSVFVCFPRVKYMTCMSTFTLSSSYSKHPFDNNESISKI